MAETDGDGSTVRRVFVYATRANVPDLVRQLEGSEWVTYRVLVDHLGSVRTVMRASDVAVLQRMDYDAFGRVTEDYAAPGWVRIPFGFAGGLYDRETGLVRFGAREYDARLGRWVSRDPALFGGGDGNLYRYCGGEPVNWVDVDGEHPIIWVSVGILIGYETGTGLWAVHRHRAEEAEQTRSSGAANDNARLEGRHREFRSGDVTGVYHCVFYCQWRAADPLASSIVASIHNLDEHRRGTPEDARANNMGLACGQRAQGRRGVRNFCLGACGVEMGNHWL